MTNQRSSFYETIYFGHQPFFSKCGQISAEAPVICYKEYFFLMVYKEGIPWIDMHINSGSDLHG